jgi:TonB-dependent starch-binding outer membrane protein SusC
VVMAEGAILEDVVVTGYGTVKRENVTGSISTVKSEDFNKGAITSPQELLAGKVPGVNVITNGEPGGGPVIRIRGGSSLSANNDPLIIIDGVPVASDPISGSRPPTG